MNQNLALALPKRPEFEVQAVPSTLKLCAPRKQRDLVQYYSDLHRTPKDSSGRTLSGKAFGRLQTTSVSRLPKMGNAGKLIVKSSIHHCHASPITLLPRLLPDNETNYLSRVIWSGRLTVLRQLSVRQWLAGSALLGKSQQEHSYFISTSILPRILASFLRLSSPFTSVHHNVS